MRNHLAILGLFAVGAVIILLISPIVGGRSWSWDGALLAIGGGLVGAAATALVVGQLISSKTEANKSELITKLGSKDKKASLDALSRLRGHGWLYDGSLRGAYLIEANLYKANLRGAVLHGAHMQWANLEEADLREACLQEADLGNANLRGAKLDGKISRGIVEMLQFSRIRTGAPGLHRACLRGANLREAGLVGSCLLEADLDHADLVGADLRRADLRGAILFNANLQGAELDQADYDESTILPTGEKWSPGVDMSRFTDPNHAEFWRPPYVTD